MTTVSITAPVSPRSQQFALFLDVDGVLHSTRASDRIDFALPEEATLRRIALVKGEIHPDEYGLLVAEKQALLLDVLRRYPHVVLVVSSAWRHWQGYNFWMQSDPDDALWEREHVQSLRWLKLLLHSLLAAGVVGKTPAIAQAPGASWTDRASRLQEIRSYMHEHGPELGLAPSWIAIDDQKRHFDALHTGVFHSTACIGSYHDEFPREAVLLVDGETGLDQASAGALDAALAKPLDEFAGLMAG